jgi:methionyl-tRNA formyltransferase
VAFHMTDLPYGRGGSPLQNLIVNKIYKTKISAIEVDEGIDTGRIYMKKDLDIKNGNAEKIYVNMAKIIFNKMIPEILIKNIKPKEQKGKITKFKRRKPEDSNISRANIKTPTEMYDFIRMLDAETYPKAFIRNKKMKIEFLNVKRIKNQLYGNFTISEE